MSNKIWRFILSGLIILAILLSIAQIEFQASQSLTTEEQYIDNQLSKNGSIEVIGQVVENETADQIYNKMQLLSTQLPENMIKSITDSNYRLDVKDIKIPDIYLEEFTRYNQQFDEKQITIKRSSLSPYVTTTVNNREDLKRFRDTGLYNIRAVRYSAPDLSVSNPYIGSPASWTRGPADSSTNDTGSNGTGLNQVIAVLDTGVATEHPMFKGKVYNQACFSYVNATFNISSLCRDGANEDFGVGAGVNCTFTFNCNHGSHVAGIAAGREVDTGLGYKMAGVAKDALVSAVQIYSNVNNTTICMSVGATAPCVLNYDSAMADGMRWVLLSNFVMKLFKSPNSIAAINLSTSSLLPAGVDCQADFRKPVIQALAKDSIAVIVSSGNNGLKTVNTIACIDEAISVGSVDNSSWSLSSFSNYGSKTDIYAPGGGIMSADSNTGYRLSSGTSMSAPQVSGAMAILKNVFPTFGVEPKLKVLKDVGNKFTFFKGLKVSMNQPIVGLCKDYYLRQGRYTCNRYYGIKDIVDTPARLGEWLTGLVK
jgi:subtilisin family serine protease